MGNITLGNITLDNSTLSNFTLGHFILVNPILGNLTLGNLTVGIPSLGTLIKLRVLLQCVFYHVGGKTHLMASLRANQNSYHHCYTHGHYCS